MEANRKTSIPANQVQEVVQPAQPTEPIQINVYQMDTYRNDLSWLHFND